MNRFKLTSSLLVIALLGSVGAAAQDDQAPPSLVGRLAGINGQVSLHRADQEDWSDAGINEPITVGDAVYTAPSGMARIQIGGTDLALLSDSEIDIAALDENTSRLRLDTGALDLRVTVLPTQDGLTVMTPRGDVRLIQPGTYRIETGSETDPTRITSWDGAAEFDGGGGATPIRPGQVLIVSGTADMPQYAYEGAGERPGEWRGRSRVVAVQNQNYVAPEMTGAEDLPQYGDWQQTPDYGPVWYPNDVQADWEPYRYGHWESVAPWGWTWIDDQPWGFAPFHYGRWANIDGRWGWCPGRYEPHPVYAPALVAFIGGAGISLSLGHGPDVGWVPLAPGEFYRPPYRGGQRYIENLNRGVGRGEGGREHFDRGGNAEAFTNRRFATVVPQDVLRGARPVGRSVVSVPAGALGHAQVGAEALRGVAPAEHTRPSGRPGPVIPPSNPAQAASVRPTFIPRGGAPGFAPRNGRPELAPQGGANAVPQGRPPAAPQGGANGVTQGRPPAAPQGGANGVTQGRPPAAPQGGANGVTQGRPPAAPQPAFARPGVPAAPPPPRGEPDRGFREGRPEPAPGSVNGVPQGRPPAAPQGGANSVTQGRPPAAPQPAFTRPGIPAAPPPPRGEPDRAMREGRPPAAPGPAQAPPPRPFAAPAGIPHPAVPEIRAPQPPQQQAQPQFRPQRPAAPEVRAPQPPPQQPQFHPQPQRPPPQPQAQPPRPQPPQAQPQRPPQPAVARPAPPPVAARPAPPPPPAPQKAPPKPGEKPKAE